MKVHPWAALIGAVVLGTGALALSAQAAGTPPTASAASAPAPGYGPGYGPGAGWRRGQGYEGGGPVGRGGYGRAGCAQGYGPCGGGWGGGPGMMGGWGGGWGGGPGMGGGWGGGWGGGPGMMGGWGGGWGGWHHAGLAQLKLSDTQVDRIEAIAHAQSDKQWALMTRLHQLMWSAPRHEVRTKADVDAMMKIAKEVSDLRLQMMRNRLETRLQVDAVLTQEQQRQLRQYRPRAW